MNQKYRINRLVNVKVPGGPLPNGAEALAFTVTPEQGVVLCYLPGNNVTPFVTWQFRTDSEGYYFGHYHVDGEAAQEEYAERAGTAMDHWHGVEVIQRATA